MVLHNIFNRFDTLLLEICSARKQNAGIKPGPLEICDIGGNDTESAINLKDTKANQVEKNNGNSFSK